MLLAPFTRWMWILLGKSSVLLLLEVSLQGRALPPIRYSHAGICPNDMNPNLWVDAQSTCKRECEADLECETFEKCCPNVCGTKSCVAARYMDVKGKKGPVGMPKEATCDRFMCIQQGSECDIWDGQPVCKCKDRCEKEPSFTCASDGLTYYNKCYMDAEACIKGITLNVVTCRYHLTWPNTSPIPPETTARPTTAYSETTIIDILPPALVNNPVHQSVYVGETVSFLCTAKNSGGLLRADFPLSVIKGEPTSKEASQNKTHFPTDECLKQPDSEDCGEEQTRWYYDAKKNNCFTFIYGNCNSNLNHFETYENCMLTCMNGPINICNLPALQGHCKAYEPRWAYNSLTKQCQSFIYGGCGGNENNFESREACEEMCPFPKNTHCKACKPRQKLVTSFCKSDFVILGRITELTEDQDSGHALVTVEEILKDEKMGLKFLGKEPLEITLLNMDWSCPCPNMTAEDGPLIIMGEVHDGMATLDPSSYVRAANDKRVKKIYELMEKKTCDLLNRFQD